MSPAAPQQNPTQSAAKPGGQAIGAQGSTDTVAARKSVFAQNRIPNMRRESDIDQIMRTGSSQTPRQPLTNPLQKQQIQNKQGGTSSPSGDIARLIQQRKGELNRNQQQSRMQGAMQPRGMNQEQLMNQKSRQKDQEQEEEENEDEDDEEDEEDSGSIMQRASLLKQALKAASIAGVLEDNLNIKRKQAQVTPEQQQTRDEAHKAIRRAVPQAINMIANALASALDVGTGGIALVVTIFIHGLTLGWWNLQMIYGKWLHKGKHKIIPPLEWYPIPIPFDKKALMFQALVIFLDLVLITFLFCVLGLLALTLYFILNPKEILNFFGMSVLGLVVK